MGARPFRLAALVTQFLVLRVSPEWEADELPAMRHWIATDGEIPEG